MQNRNPFTLFQPSEFEAKYRGQFGLASLLAFIVTTQQNLSVYLKVSVLLIFPIIAVVIYKRMIKEYREEPKVRKDYFVYMQVLFLSITVLIVFFMLFSFGLEYFI